MIKHELHHIVNSYKQEGIVKVNELLLPLAVMLRFLDDLEKIQIVILGVDGWRRVNGDPNKIAQDSSIDYFVGDDVVNFSNPSEISIGRVREYLLSLPQKTPFVSLTLDIPEAWVDEIFTEGN